MEIALLGYGNMGQRIQVLAEKENHSVPVILDIENNISGSGMTRPVFEHIDVAIDFSHPAAVQTHIQKLLELGIPAVIGTTGWLEEPAAVSKLCKQYEGRLLYGSNFSLGVQLFIKLVARAGELFGKSALFDAALHEVHHTRKADAPSGTAKTLAGVWLEAAGSSKKPVFQVPEKQEINKNDFLMTSQRLGSVYGEHQLRINSLYDDIMITHQARSRDAFAAGSLKAASWLVRQEPGFYMIEDVIEEVLRV
ncbi:MAG: 4-hydroxy-tetrahydrodipicolinate reductase [Balneolales bacterium]